MPGGGPASGAGSEQVVPAHLGDPADGGLDVLGVGAGGDEQHIVGVDDDDIVEPDEGDEPVGAGEDHARGVDVDDLAFLADRVDG